MKTGSVVQLDRISDFGSEGWRFESSLSHFFLFFIFTIFNFNAQVITSKIKLPSYINETSGLEIIDDFLVTHNDSGNDAILYYLNENGNLIFERNFKEFENIDWEDLAVDDDYIYIADMGNNYDTRLNLRIIKVPINSKINSYEIINFYYPEQKSYKFRRKSIFDAEALISVDDFLYIFTKNRAEKTTDIYRLPKKGGTWAAKKISTLNTNSIVTAADYSIESKLLVLTSTIDFNNYYILKIENFDLKNIGNSYIEMFEIPIGKTQVEAIKIIDKSSFWLTSENEDKGSPFLYKILL